MSHHSPDSSTREWWAFQGLIATWLYVQPQSFRDPITPSFAVDRLTPFLFPVIRLPRAGWSARVTSLDMTWKEVWT